MNNETEVPLRWAELFKIKHTVHPRPIKRLITAI